MFATHADARAAAERRKSLSPMSVASTPSPPRREADDEERRRSAAADDEERRRSAAALEAERRRSDALRESREALARETVWKSNLQPDFNVRVIERIAPYSSAVLRELDESNRFVQKSAESTTAPRGPRGRPANRGSICRFAMEDFDDAALLAL